MTTGSPAGSPGGFARVRRSLSLPLFISIYFDIQKSETAHSLRPMTIYQLIQANQAHTDADWVLDDQEIGQVKSQQIWMCGLLITLFRSPLSRILPRYKHRRRIVNTCLTTVQAKSRPATGPIPLWRMNQRRTALCESTSCCCICDSLVTFVERGPMYGS